MSSNGRKISDLSGDGLNVLLRDLLCNASVSNQMENVTRLNSSFSQLFQITNLMKVSTFQNVRLFLQTIRHNESFCTFEPSPGLSALSEASKTYRVQHNFFLIFFILQKREREREGDEQKEQKMMLKTNVEKQQHSIKLYQGLLKKLR